MAGSSGKAGLIFLLLVSLVLTILVIPGVGLETRSIGSFPAWQQTLFMEGGPIVLVLNLLALALATWRAKAGAVLAILVGLAVLVFSTVGLLGFGAPAVPMNLVWIEVLHILDGLGLVLFGGIVLSRPSQPPQPIVPP